MIEDLSTERYAKEEQKKTLIADNAEELDVNEQTIGMGSLASRFVLGNFQECRK